MMGEPYLSATVLRMKLVLSRSLHSSLAVFLRKFAAFVYIYNFPLLIKYSSMCLLTVCSLSKYPFNEFCEPL